MAATRLLGGADFVWPWPPWWRLSSFLVAFLALALVGVFVVACLAFSEVGAALGARGFLAAGASSSAATRRVRSGRGASALRDTLLRHRGAVGGCRVQGCNAADSFVVAVQLYVTDAPSIKLSRCTTYGTQNPQIPHFL